MPRYSKLAEFARTRGAKDKRPRKKRADSLDDQYKSARTNELRTRSIANLGRTLNSVGNSVREVRLTARWLGINPARKRSDPMSIIRNARSGSDAGNSFLRLVRGVSGTRSQNSRTIVNGKGVISSVTAVGRSGGLFGMRSLNSMMAEFRRGKDKKKRKIRKPTILQNALYGAALTGAPGAISGATGEMLSTRVPVATLRNGQTVDVFSTKPSVILKGALKGAIRTAPIGAALGAGSLIAARELRKLREREK